MWYVRAPVSPPCQRHESLSPSYLTFQVEIGLLHDLAYATSVATEPATSDDWEILVSP